jgi:phosphatidylglycerol lysyltransferase
MGRYSRDYLSRQRVYIAWQAGQPVAFASFHQTPNEWALDLMRHGPRLPNGTMQSLVQTAIDDAALAGVPRLSLAAVPEAAFNAGARRHTRLCAR